MRAIRPLRAVAVLLPLLAPAFVHAGSPAPKLQELWRLDTKG
jgi:hypothetical protein